MEVKLEIIFLWCSVLWLLIHPCPLSYSSFCMNECNYHVTYQWKVLRLCCPNTFLVTSCCEVFLSHLIRVYTEAMIAQTMQSNSFNTYMWQLLLGWFFIPDPLVNMVECHWTRYWTPNCSWWCMNVMHNAPDNMVVPHMVVTANSVGMSENKTRSVKTLSGQKWLKKAK